MVNARDDQPRGLRDADAVSPRPFSDIQRAIGLVDQLVGFSGIVRIGRQAQADGEVSARLLFLVRKMGCLDAPTKAFGEDESRFAICFRHDDGEFFPAVTRSDVHLSACFFEKRGQLLQYAVSHEMAVRVIIKLEGKGVEKGSSLLLAFNQ